MSIVWQFSNHSISTFPWNWGIEEVRVSIAHSLVGVDVPPVGSVIPVCPNTTTDSSVFRSHTGLHSPTTSTLWCTRRHSIELVLLLSGASLFFSHLHWLEVTTKPVSECMYNNHEGSSNEYFDTCWCCRGCLTRLTRRMYHFERRSHYLSVLHHR